MIIHLGKLIIVSLGVFHSGAFKVMTLQPNLFFFFRIHPSG